MLINIFHVVRLILCFRPDSDRYNIDINREGSILTYIAN